MQIKTYVINIIIHVSVCRELSSIKDLSQGYCCWMYDHVQIKNSNPDELRDQHVSQNKVNNNIYIIVQRTSV